MRDAPATVALIGGTVLPCAPPGSPDGTPTPQRPGRPTAVAIAGNRIGAIGTDRDIEALIGQETTVISLDGKTVIPGINDSHLHAAWLGALWPRTLFDATADNSVPGGDPARVRLDGDAARRAAIMRAGDICAELGITSYTEPGLGPGEDDDSCFGEPVLAEYATLADEGKLRARVTVLRLFGRLDGPSTLADFVAGLATPTAGARDASWLAVTGVKIFADGIPPMRSAWTRHEYPDGSRGSLLVAGRDPADREANLRAMVRHAAAAGVQVAVHATGDRAIEVAVDALAAVETARPHHIVHGDLASGAVIDVMASRGIGISVQPGIAIATRDMVRSALGGQVAGSAWPLGRLLDRGVRVTLSSDAPVLSPDWRAQLAAAGALLGMPGTHPALMARLLACYTAVAAAQDGTCAWKGSLEPGKVADLCVLSEDPRWVPTAEAGRLQVCATVVDGRVVYKALLE